MSIQKNKFSSSDNDKFEELVFKAIQGLPLRFKSRLENVDIVIQDRPTPEQKEEAGVGRNYDLLGLYEGIPIPSRHSGYNMVLPDKITIFRKPLENLGLSDKALEQEIADVVRHELAHHFGISDERLEQIKGPEDKF